MFPPLQKQWQLLSSLHPFSNERSDYEIHMLSFIIHLPTIKVLEYIYIFLYLHVQSHGMDRS